MRDNFAGKGWLSRYISVRRDVLNVTADRQELEKLYYATSRDHSLYKNIQPTGLLYGHPVNLTNARTSLIASLADKDRMKVILAESFFTNSLLSRFQYIHNEKDMQEIMDDSTIGISQFYQQLYPAFQRNIKDFIIRRSDFYQMAEMVLTNRVLYARPKKYRTNFWSRFFSNSLLFLDVFYYGEWMLSEDRRSTSDRIAHAKEEMRSRILQVIGAASYSDGSLDAEERKLFDYFLRSADLLPLTKRILREQFNDGIKLEDIDFDLSNWILKRYLLEIAILTVWSDKQVLESEKEFLSALTTKLGFTETEKENATLAIESFIIEYWDQVNYLQGNSFALLGEKYGERISFVMEAHELQLKNDIYRNRYLVTNLEKYQNGTISEHEKHKTKILMINILKRIPSFNIISLPSNYLTLDKIISRLPASCLPKTVSHEYLER